MGAAMLSWVPYSSPCLSPGLGLSPLQSGLHLRVVPSWAPRDLGGRGRCWVWEWGCPPLPPSSESHQWALVAPGSGRGH